MGESEKLQNLLAQVKEDLRLHGGCRVCANWHKGWCPYKTECEYGPGEIDHWRYDMGVNRSD